MRAADVIKYLGNNFKFLQILTSKKLFIQIVRFEQKYLDKDTRLQVPYFSTFFF